MEIAIRARTVEYRISFIARSRETFIYLGSMWVGRIMHAHCDPIHRDAKFAVYIQLPGLWGPTDRCENLQQAKIAATEAVKRWMRKFTETPEPPPEQLVRALARQDKAAVSRVKRTRPEAPAPVKRVARTRG